MWAVAKKIGEVLEFSWGSGTSGYITVYIQVTVRNRHWVFLHIVLYIPLHWMVRGREQWWRPPWCSSPGRTPRTGVFSWLSRFPSLRSHTSKGADRETRHFQPLSALLSRSPRPDICQSLHVTSGCVFFHSVSYIYYSFYECRCISPPWGSYAIASNQSAPSGFC